MRWRTKIIGWSPPRQFIDLQIRGPYALWHHQHTFEPAREGKGSVCFDRINYRLPAGPLGRVVHGIVVGRQLKEIFRFRRDVIAAQLGWKRAVQEDVQIRPLS